MPAATVRTASVAPTVSLLIAVVLEAYSRSPTAKLDCPVPPEVAGKAVPRDMDAA
jgi:hypothetical protein